MQQLVGAYWNYDDLRERADASIDGRHGNDAIPLLDRAVIVQAREWLAGDELDAADPD